MSMAGNPDQGFLCQKTIRKEYDDDVNLWMEREREKEEEEEEKKKDHKSNNSTLICGLMVDLWG